jgi:hypothetical protein
VDAYPNRGMSTKLFTCVAVAFSAVALLGGYFLGKSGTNDGGEAAAAKAKAKRTSFTAARFAASRRAKVRGRLRGATLGRRQARWQGASAGITDGAIAAEAAVAEIAAEEARASATECGSGEYNYEGNGCVPNDCPGLGCAHPPTPPATPETCPPGQLPVGVTGACASPRTR